MALPVPLSPLPLHPPPGQSKFTLSASHPLPPPPRQSEFTSSRGRGGRGRGGELSLPPAFSTEQRLRYIETFIFDYAGGPVQLPVAERAPGRETQRARLHPGLRPLRGQP